MAEQELISRLLEIQTESLQEQKQGWFADAYSFLSSVIDGHWWCRHGDVTAGLAEVSSSSEGASAGNVLVQCAFARP
jgi:hypothetical protein